MFDVMNSEVVVARETDEIVLVTFVVAHEDVLAMDAAIIPPPTFGFLDGLTFWVVVGGEGYVVLREIAKHPLLAVGDNFEIKHIVGSYR